MRAAGRLGDAVRDEVHGVQPRHVLQLQEVHGVALALAEQRDQDVRARHLVAAGGLHVDGGSLDHALEAGGRLGVAGALRHQAGEILVEELGQVAFQLVGVHTTSPQHIGRVAVVGQREQEVFERRVLVPAFVRQAEGAVERLFEVTGKHAQNAPKSGPAPKAFGSTGGFRGSR